MRQGGRRAAGPRAAGPLDRDARRPGRLRQPRGPAARAAGTQNARPRLEGGQLRWRKTARHFADTAGNVHAERIDQLAEAGIVRGLRPGEYGPRVLATRDQMASFLIRAYELIAGRDLPAPAHGFGDVAGNVHETAVAKAAAAELTAGVSPTAYGPRRPARRDQMASFLARTPDRLVADGTVAGRP